MATNLSAADKTASAQIKQTLGVYGLGSLGAWAWNEWKQGKTVDQIYLDMAQTPEYKARFPAMDTLAKNGQAISEQQYIQLETSYKQIAQAAGLPPGFYDQPEDFTNLITNNVAPTEYKARVDLATQASLTAPTETRQALQDIYGVSGGALTAYWLDPNKALPLIQQQFAAAQASGTATLSGYGALGRSEAERVASFGLTQDALNTGFGTLEKDQQLFNGLPGEQTPTITRQQQLDAALGQSAKDQLEIDKVAAQRVAAFGDKSRDYATSAKGITGLGSNPS